MGFFKYISSLAGIKSKADMKEIYDDAENTLLLLEGSIDKTISLAIDDRKLEKEMGQLGRIIKRNINTSKKELMPKLKELLSNAKENVAFIQKELGTNDLALNAMTIRQTNMVSDLGHVAFFSDYITGLFLRVAHISLKDRGVKPEFPVNKDTAELLTHKMINFVEVADTLCLDPKKYKAHILAMPELSVRSETEEAMLLDSKTPGINTKSVKNFYYSSFHVLSRILADMHAKRYHRLKEEYRELELYLAILEANEDGLNTAVLEKEIEQTKSRIDKLDYEISKEEE